MNTDNSPLGVCPICSGKLEKVKVNPCFDNGHKQIEIQHFLDGEHTFETIRFFGRFDVVLCDFCEEDFPSYDPEYFALPEDASDELERRERLGPVETSELQEDLYCPKCDHRLAFLNFLVNAREYNRKKYGTSSNT